MRKLLLLLILVSTIATIAGAQVSGVGSFGCSGTAVTGTVINSSTANNTVVETLSNFPAWGVLVQLDQTTTITAGAVTFNISFDGGANFVAVPVAQVLNPSTYQQLTNPYTLVASTNQSFLISLNGASNFQTKLTTAMTGTGTITPLMTAMCVAPPGLQYDSSGNAKVNISAQSLGKVLVTPDALPANQSVNVAQINGATTSTAASGVQKVGIVGNTGTAVDAATNASPPSNGVQHIEVSATALPTAVTATNTVAPMADKFGRRVVIPFAMRDLIKTAAVQTTSATQTTLLASQTSQFADLVSLTVTSESATACTMALTDGTTTYKFNVANQQGAGFTWNPATPVPAANTATAWQVTGCASVTLDYVAEFVLNK